MITLREYYSNTPIGHSKFLFSGGEVSIKVEEVKYCEHVVITANIFSSDDIMELLLVADALRRITPPSKLKHLTLVLPYVPYGRQDRVCNKGESLSIKVFANLINDLCFDKVVTWDNHSDVSTALINNCYNIPLQSLVSTNTKLDNVRHKLSTGHYSHIVSPDVGSLKKCYSFAKEFNIGVIVANKVRDVRTGEITETQVLNRNSLDTLANVLVVDDICDGGRTFIELNKVLRGTIGCVLNKYNVDLLTTHGIYSRGKEVLSCYDNLYCANEFPEIN